MLEIHDSLWIGNALDIRTPERLFGAGISAVVDLAYEELPAQLPRQLIYCRFPINDGAGNEATVVRIAIEMIVHLVAVKLPTLVGCSAGTSRSPTFAAAALAVHLDQPLEETIGRIAESRSLDVSGTLWSDVVTIVSDLRG